MISAKVIMPSDFIINSDPSLDNIITRAIFRGHHLFAKVCIAARTHNCTEFRYYYYIPITETNTVIPRVIMEFYFENAIDKMHFYDDYSKII